MSNFILRACRVWHSWLGLGSVNTVEDLEEEIEDKKVLEIKGACSNDLTVAGVRIFGRDFQFKISQRRIATDLYLSGKKFFPIQALPGYGKTALFELPLVAMKLRQPTKRICSFVFVPYISLMANMIERLSKHGLKCKAVKDILVWNSVPDETTLDADIYVCSYEDVTSDCLKTMINNWYFHYKSTYLGFIVIDEVHNFGHQDYRKKVTEQFPQVNFDAANKVLFLSGSIGIDNFDFHLKELGMNVKTTSMIEVNDKVFITNLVREIPLRNVKKEFKKIKYEDLLDETIQYVNKFLSVTKDSKALIVCRTKKDVSNLAGIGFSLGKPLALTGDLPTEDKIRIINSFSSDDKKRVLVGTNMVSEGIDIKNLKLVILVDYVPSVSEYIQIGGRLRNGGLYTCFYSRIYPERERIQMINPRENVNDQMKKFYGLTGKFEDNYKPDLEKFAKMLMTSKNVALNHIPLLVHPNKGKRKELLEEDATNDIDAYENEEDDIVASQEKRKQKEKLPAVIQISDDSSDEEVKNATKESGNDKKKKGDDKLYDLLQKKRYSRMKKLPL